MSSTKLGTSVATMNDTNAVLQHIDLEGTPLCWRGGGLDKVEEWVQEAVSRHSLAEPISTLQALVVHFVDEPGGESIAMDLAELLRQFLPAISQRQDCAQQDNLDRMRACAKQFAATPRFEPKPAPSADSSIDLPLLTRFRV